MAGRYQFSACRQEGAAYELVPVWAVLDDEVQVRYLLEEVLDTLAAIVRAVFDDSLPPLCGVKSDDIAHSYLSATPFKT